MKGKYAKYIKSRYGFVIDYVLKDNQLLVHTSETKLSEPQLEEATPERFKYYEERKETQYKLIIQNQDKIIKENSIKARTIIYIISALLIIASFCLTPLNIPLVYTASCFMGGVSLIALGETAIALVKDSFKSKLKTYNEYIKNCEKIEQRAKTDRNITQYLNQESVAIIKQNKTLKKHGYIENVFNIDLMDKMTLQEIRQLLLRYKISQALEETQTFNIPGEKTKPKTRELTK